MADLAACCIATAVSWTVLPAGPTYQVSGVVLSAGAPYRPSRQGLRRCPNSVQQGVHHTCGQLVDGADIDDRPGG
ncbi:hypothetical protein ACPEIC_39910 [Stenotrophomonas sp. NPDC087984]